MLLIFPVEGEFNVPGATPILGTLALFFNDGNEVFNVLFLVVLCVKFIDDEVEHQVTVKMFPKSGGYGKGHISKGIKELVEAVVGKPVCLEEFIHTFMNLSIDVSIGDLRFKVVEVDDGWRH